MVSNIFSQKTLPPLVKGQSMYNLVVPEEVEEKIRYLLRKYPSTEWSGVLFVTHEGSFETNDLIITCKDIYPMDLGNATFTEFKMDEDVAAYMADNIELFNCELMLIHSHHQMSTQPSGTDLNTLREEGNERNCFVSLIVNNAGTYYAAVTRKTVTKSEITIKKLDTSYEFFGEGNKEITYNESPTTNIVDKEVIEYFDLKVDRHEVLEGKPKSSLKYLDDRFDEILKKKSVVPDNKEPLYINKGFYSWLHTKEDNTKPLQQNLFYNYDTVEWIPDTKKIHEAVVKIIACSLIVNTEKFDLKQWIKRYMVKVYQRNFSINSLDYDSLEYNSAFQSWKDFIIEYVITNFDLENAPDAIYGEDMIYSIIAKAIIKELAEFVGENPYIDSYIDTLSCYILIDDLNYE